MVSKARLDLPLPDSPVMTIRRSRGSERSKPLRLCSRAPWMSMLSWGTAPSLPGRAWGPTPGPSGRGGPTIRSRRGLVEAALATVERMSEASGRSRSAELDALRAVAALAVLFFHAGGLVYDSSSRFDGVWAVRYELRTGVD